MRRVGETLTFLGQLGRGATQRITRDGVVSSRHLPSGGVEQTCVPCQSYHCLRVQIGPSHMNHVVALISLPDGGDPREHSLTQKADLGVKRTTTGVLRMSWLRILYAVKCSCAGGFLHRCQSTAPEGNGHVMYPRWFYLHLDATFVCRPLFAAWKVASHHCTSSRFDYLPLSAAHRSFVRPRFRAETPGGISFSRSRRSKETQALRVGANIESSETDTLLAEGFELWQVHRVACVHRASGQVQADLQHRRLRFLRGKKPQSQRAYFRHLLVEMIQQLFSWCEKPAKSPNLALFHTAVVFTA